MTKEFTTLENVTLEFKKADIFARFGAALIDFMLLLGVSLLVWFAIWLIAGHGGGGSVMMGTLVVIFLIRTFYFVYLESSPGNATIGKRAFRLRVIRNTSLPLTMQSVLTRNFVKELEVNLPVQSLLILIMLNQHYGLVLFFAAWTLLIAIVTSSNEDGMRFGDICAGTMVIQMKEQKLEEDKFDENSKVIFSREQLSYYGIYELQVLETVLRYPDSPRTTRLKEAIAEKIKKRIDWPDDSLPVEEFLTAFYTAQRTWLERGNLFRMAKQNKLESAPAEMTESRKISNAKKKV